MVIARDANVDGGADSPGSVKNSGDRKMKILSNVNSPGLLLKLIDRVQMIAALYMAVRNKI